MIEVEIIFLNGASGNFEQSTPLRMVFIIRYWLKTLRYLTSIKKIDNFE